MDELNGNADTEPSRALPEWLLELLIACGVLLVSCVFILWKSGELPGGLHWENYDHAFIVGMIHSGQATAAEMWEECAGRAGAALACAVLSFLQAVFQTGWGTQGVSLTCELLAVATVLLTYGLARTCLDRKLSLVAVLFLLSCPAFLTQARCGRLQGILDAAAGVLCVGTFLLAHRRRKPLYLLVWAYALSLSYFSSYVSFPVLVLSLPVMLGVGALCCREALFKVRWYVAAVAAFAVFVLLNGSLLSVLYCDHEPMFVVKALETYCFGITSFLRPFLPQAGAPASVATLGGASMVGNNILNFLRDFFWSASPAYKTFVPATPAAVWPFDHLGAMLPGSPALYLPVTLLLLAGAFQTLRSRRLGFMVVGIVWATIFAIAGVAGSYQGRRLLSALPFICVTAAFGFAWIEGLIRRRGDRIAGALTLLLVGGLAAHALWALDVRFPRYLKTLQFSVYKDVGAYARQHLDPKQDVIVLLDKSVMFPTAFYPETGFLPYRLIVMSEFYFPTLLACDTGNLYPQTEEPHAPVRKHVPHLFRYCNMPFPATPFDVAPEIKNAAWRSFASLLEREVRAGRHLYLLASLPEEQAIETGALQLNSFLLRELANRSVRLETLATFGPETTGNRHAIICRISLSQG